MRLGRAVARTIVGPPRSRCMADDSADAEPVTPTDTAESSQSALEAEVPEPEAETESTDAAEPEAEEAERAPAADDAAAPKPEWLPALAVGSGCRRCAGRRARGTDRLAGLRLLPGSSRPAAPFDVHGDRAERRHQPHQHRLGTRRGQRPASARHIDRTVLTTTSTSVRSRSSRWSSRSSRSRSAPSPHRGWSPTRTTRRMSSCR